MHFFFIKFTYGRRMLNYEGLKAIMENVFITSPGAIINFSKYNKYNYNKYINKVY